MAHSSISAGIVVATFAAGPLFITAAAVGSLCLQSPQSIAVEPSDALWLVFGFFFASAGGCILSIVPNLVGTSLLAWLADRWPTARRPEFWTTVGILAGVGIAIADGPSQSPSAAFAVIVTSAACAWLCRRPIVWDAPDP